MEASLWDLSHNLLSSKACSEEHRDGAATRLKAQPGPSVQIAYPSSEDLVERTPECLTEAQLRLGHPD